MGLIIMRTCADCGNQSIPTMEGNLTEGYKMRCQKCGGCNFKPRDPQNTFKVNCPSCSHEYPFNDVGCPKCIMQELRDRGVEVKRIK